MGLFDAVAGVLLALGPIVGAAGGTILAVGMLLAAFGLDAVPAPAPEAEPAVPAADRPLAA